MSENITLDMVDALMDKCEEASLGELKFELDKDWEGRFHLEIFEIAEDDDEDLDVNFDRDYCFGKEGWEKVDNLFKKTLEEVYEYLKSRYDPEA